MGEGDPDKRFADLETHLGALRVSHGKRIQVDGISAPGKNEQRFRIPEMRSVSSLAMTGHVECDS
jgi:hypothetical protein